MGSLRGATPDSQVALFSPLVIGSVVANGASGITGWQKVNAALESIKKEVITSKPQDIKHLTNLTYKQLLPKHDRHDGNRCAEGEEEFGSLCYERCSKLTLNYYPIRTSAWSCCK